MPAIHTRQAAERLARMLVTGVALPPHSRMDSSAPLAALTRPLSRPGTPNLATATRYATAPGTVASATAFFAVHPPAGYTKEGSGSEGSITPTRSTHAIMDAIGRRPAGVPSATVLLAATAGTPGRVDLRVDAQVTWLPPKPGGLSVPARDTVAMVSVLETAPAAQVAREHLPPPRRVVVRSGPTFDRLRAAADGLPTALPGVTRCPADLGTSYLVTFAPSATIAPSISYTAGNCGYVTVQTAGRTVGLADDSSFETAYQHILGPAMP